LSILLFKLVMTPLFIGAVSLAGRRWGPAVSGLLVGLPLSSGPISLFMALQYGSAFAAKAAVGNVVGMASSCLFFLVYGLAARRWRWFPCALAALLAFGLSTLLCNRLSWNLGSAILLLLAMILAVPRLLGREPAAQPPMPPPAWDLPARMAAATAFVCALTGSAQALGPQLSGLIAPLPVFGVVLGSFIHHRQGAAGSLRYFRGNAVGALAFIGFFAVVGPGLGRAPLPVVYLLASLGSMAASGLAFLAIHRKVPWLTGVFGL
jgi:hypothetical protein